MHWTSTEHGERPIDCPDLPCPATRGQPTYRSARSRLCAQALSTVLQEYDGQDGNPHVSFMLGGHPSTFEDGFSELPGAAAFVAILKQRFPSTWEPSKTGFETLRSACGRCVYRSFTSDTDRVPMMYADVDIGIVPNRLGTPFNDSRGNVKGLEMAGVSVPCIASLFPAYQEWRGDPDTGCIVLPDNEPKTWLSALRHLIEDEELRTRMGAEARSFAHTRSIDRWAARWMDVYVDAARRRGLTWAA